MQAKVIANLPCVVSTLDTCFYIILHWYYVELCGSYAIYWYYFNYNDYLMI